MVVNGKAIHPVETNGPVESIVYENRGVETPRGGMNRVPEELLAVQRLLGATKGFKNSLRLVG